MSNLDVVEYKNDAKRAWRREVWEAIGKWRGKVGGPVLYLAGSRDLDSHLARRHGVREDDLIAVESDADVAKKLRDTGRNTIYGKLEDVMFSWPKHTPPSAVIADFCCNLHARAFQVSLCWALRPVFQKSVLVVNLQRGREANPVWNVIQKLTAAGRCEEKNRAKILFAVLASALTGNCTYSREEGTVEPITNSLDDFLKHIGRVILPPYKSSVVLMDSLILFHRRPLREDWLREFDSKADMKRKISAALAIRTSRLRVAA